VGAALSVADADCDGVADCVAVTLLVPVCDAVGDSVMVAVPVIGGVAAAVAIIDSVLLDVGVSVPLRDGE